MTTTKNNEHNKLNFSSEREQSQACLNSAEHEKNQGRKVLNVPNKQEQNQTCLDSAEREGLRPKGNVPNLRFPEFQGEWEKCKLSEICTFFSGGTPSSSNKDFYGGNIAFIRSGELHADSTELFITQAGFDSSSAKMVEVGDLLLAMYGATSGDIAVSKIKGAINQAILCIRTKQNKKFIESVWNKHVSKNLRKYLQGGQGNLSADIVKGISFFFPTLKEQEKIANLVSLLDERIATQNKIIDKLQSLIKGIGKQLFMDNQNWRTVKIGELLRIGNGKDYKHLSIGKIPVYGTGGQMLLVNDYLYDGESVCIGRKGTIDTPMFLKGKFWTVDTLFYTYDFKDVLPKFCYYLFLQINWKLYNEGTGVPSLSKSTIENIKVKIPSLEQQQKICSILDCYEHKTNNEEQILELYHSEKQYLLRQMFI